MMNRNEILEKIAQIVLENPELKESMGMLMGGLGQTEEAVILVVHCENSEIEEKARIFVKSQVRRLNLKSKSVDGGCVELNYEVRLKEDSSAFVNELEAMPGVSRVVLVSYNGDYMG